MKSHCSCGGETQLEYFDHPSGIQWFFRCVVCKKMSDSSPTAEEAVKNFMNAHIDKNKVVA